MQRWPAPSTARAPFSARALFLATAALIFAARAHAQTAGAQPPIAGPAAPLAPLPPSKVPLPAVPRDALPAVFYIGDSTVRNGNGTGANGEWGWGDLIPAYFDTTRVHVVNDALGGRSSRTYLTQGHWDRVRSVLRPGDVVVMQFGHNDAGALNDTSRARGSIRGVGEETEAIDNLLTRQHEVVHSYGWYLRRFIADARARGATPVVASPVPRDMWANGAVVRNAADYAGWAAAVAKAEGVPFLDLNELIAREYDALGPDKVGGFFPHDHTHTSRDGAALSARVVVAALRGLPNDPVAPYLSPAAAAVAPAAR